MLLLAILFKVQRLPIQYLLKLRLIYNRIVMNLKIFLMVIFIQQLVEHKIYLSYN